MPFSFGQNWHSFARHALMPIRVAEARHAFLELTAGIPLQGKTFLDIGFGQGLACCLAAEADAEVYGIDLDPENLKAVEITRTHFPDIPQASLAIGSILNPSEIAQLTVNHPQGFDVVHSWGVLHHTGAMHQALENAARLVAPEGHLIISIYNRHWSSPLWRIIKRYFTQAPSWLQLPCVALFFPVIASAKYLVTRENPFKKERGMDFYHDLTDWLGGYPYEYAPAEEIRTAIARLGFEVLRERPAQVPTGCNEFVTRKRSANSQLNYS